MMSAFFQVAMKLNILPTIAASVVVLTLLHCAEGVKEKKGGGHRRKLKPIEESDDGSLSSKEPEISEFQFSIR